MYKAKAEIEAALAVPYSGPTQEKNGFTYIPARESIKTMNEVFGPLGWSDEIVAVDNHPEQGIYAAAIKITAHYLDDEDGAEREVTRGDVGRSTADATGKEREAGNTSSVSRQLIVHDRAAAAAATDAFSRATKKFGPALGSFLYDKPGTTQQKETPQQANSDLGPRPSEKQQVYLKKAGIDWATMQTKEWKAALDAYFAQPKKPRGDDEF